MRFLKVSFLSLFALALAGNHDDLEAQFGAARPNRSWDEAYTLAKAFIAQLSTSEKKSLITGTGIKAGPCSGTTKNVERLGYPYLCLQDGPAGIRGVDQVTVFPAGVTTGATFDRQLMYLRSRAMGVENRIKGVNVALAPVAGALGRLPDAGRNWEGFGSDPYIQGIANGLSVKGLQDEGVIACVKHWVGNEQERYRLVIENLLSFTTPPIVESLSSNIGPQALREIYEWPFQDAVDAGVGSVMCAYQQVNNTYSCESELLIREHLKSNSSGNLGFRGFVVTDWFAAAAPGKASDAGVDMIMPGDLGLMATAASLRKASDGALDPEKHTRLDEAVLRVVAAWYKMGQDKDYPEVNFSSNNNATSGFLFDRFYIGVINKRVDASKEPHAEVQRRVATEGSVLLKNEGALPLSESTKKIGVFGSDAGPIPNGPNSCGEFHTCSKGILAVGWGSGAGTFEFLTDPLQAITAHAASTGAIVESVLDDFNYTGVDAVARDKDVCLTFIQSRSGEGLANVEGNVGDRNLTAWHGGDELVKRVASNCANTVVVVHSVGPIIMEPWIENPNVTAVVMAHLPGQDAGTPLVKLLWGAENFSGKLPYTNGKKPEDWPALVQSKYTGPAPEDTFEEGTLIDYRWFESKGIEPRFEFGYGLSYTTFNYDADSLTVTKTASADNIDSAERNDIVLTVTADITNTGDVAGKEVAQLYITYPDSTGDGRWLRGFDKLALAPGETKTATFEVRKRDVSYWVESEKEWRVAKGGEYKIEVAASSRDVRGSKSVAF